MSGIKINTMSIPNCTSSESVTVQDLCVLSVLTCSNMMLSPCGCHHALLGCGSGAHGHSPTARILAPNNHDGRCNSKTGVRSYHNTDHHGKRERAENLATHQVQYQNGEEGQSAGQDGTGERLIDGLVHDLRKRFAAHEPEILPHAIENDNGIVHRIA